MTSTYKRSHIKIACDEEDSQCNEDITPIKFDLFSEPCGSSLLQVKKAIDFSSQAISRENSSDSFIYREVEKKDLFLPIINVKFEDLYDWSLHNSSRNALPMMLKPKTGTVTRCNNKKLALFRYAEKVFAIDEKCPHQGGPLHLGDIETLGEANIICVVCPWHKWRIELPTGKVKIPPKRGGVRNMVYPTKIAHNGSISVGFSEIDDKYFNGDTDF